MMESILVRSANLEDLPILYEFEQGIIEAERPLDPTLKRTHINYYDLEELVNREDAEVAVAVVENQIVGSGYVKINKAKPYLRFDQYGYVGFMFVDPSQRGKGISGLLIDHFKKWAKAKGLTEIRLEVYQENESAVRAYEKSGFLPNLLEMRMDITGQD